MQDLTTEQFYNGNVKRWHAHHSQAMRDCGDTIGAHHTRCLGLVYDFCLHPSDSLLWAVFRHDQHEVILGDMPFTAKRDWPSLAAAYERAAAEIDGKYNVPQPANQYECDVIKFVDRLDAYMMVLKHDTALLGDDDWLDARMDLLNLCEALDFDANLLKLKMGEPK